MSSDTYMQRPSPNFDARADGLQIQLLIIHYTGLPSLDESLERLTNAESKVSAHYLIDEDGNIFKLVEEDKRAWHAGLSGWRGESDINSLSIGIELQNPGHEWGLSEFPEPQMDALAALALEILEPHGIGPEGILGHSDVAPDRKQDPGELFDWGSFADKGLGLWHDLAPETISSTQLLGGPEAELFLADLEKFGYDLGGAEAEQVFRAFQRHWRAAAITGQADEGSAIALKALLKKLNL